MANPYLNPTVDNVLGDITRNYNLSTAPAYDAAMLRSGSFGNSGVQQMQGESQRQLQQSLGRAASDLRYGDYWNNENLNRSLYNDAFSQNQSNLQLGMGLLGAMNGYNQQDLTNATAVQNTPLNYWGQFSQAANSIGQGFGTRTGTQGTSSSPLTGALGGAQLAQAWRGWNGGGSTNGNGGWSFGGQTYNNPSAFGGSQPYMPDTNTYTPTW
jgi:hypothetical protein